MGEEKKAPVRPDVKDTKLPDLLSKEAAATMNASFHAGPIAPFHKSAQQWWGLEAPLLHRDAQPRRHDRDLHEGEQDGGERRLRELLQAIEGVGWVLRDIGYVYQPLKERSHAFSDSAHMTGDILGIYTFAKPDPE